MMKTKIRYVLVMALTMMAATVLGSSNVDKEVENLGRSPVADTKSIDVGTNIIDVKNEAEVVNTVGTVATLPQRTEIEKRAVISKPFPVKEYPVAKASGSKLSNPAPVADIPRKYLIENGIEVQGRNVSEYKAGRPLNIHYPQISGLLDEKVQNKINSDFKKFADDSMEYFNVNSDSVGEVMVNYTVEANYNNLLCIDLFRYTNNDLGSQNEHFTFTYELVTGKKLALEDLFNGKTGYPEVINKAVILNVLSNNRDESMLKKPFAGIREEQAFGLTRDSLRIIIDSKNDEFSLFNFFMFGPGYLDVRIPLNSVEGLADIYGRYMNPGKKLYVNESYKKIMLSNNISMNQKQKVNRQGNFTYDYKYYEPAGFENKELEKQLRMKMGDIDLEGMLSRLKKKYGEDAKFYCYGSWNIGANFNHYLSLSRWEGIQINQGVYENSTTTYNYNIKTGKQLALADLFKQGFDYKKRLAEIAKLRGDKVSVGSLEQKKLEEMLAETEFFFTENELHLNIKVNGSSPNGFMQVWIPFSDIGEENLTIKE